MTIDEVIAREKRICKENQKVVDTHIICEDVTLEEFYCDDTEVIEEHLNNYKFASEYHKQIAELLEELVDYRRFNGAKTFDNGFKQGEKYGYNKAINDCKTYIGLHRKYAEHSIDDYVNYLQMASWLNNKIAEQINSK